MNPNPPSRTRLPFRRPPPRRATARRGRPGGLPRFTTGSARDAINLRWNYKDAINLATGEWTRAGYRAPACYVTNASPLVKATFSVAPTTLPEVRLFAETAAAIGGFAVTNVSFSNGAASNVVLLTRSATTNCVLKETFDLTWKAVVSNETKTVTNTLGKTDGHVFYTILGEPKLPWTDIECVLRVLLDDEVIGEDVVRLLVSPFLVMSNADTVLDIYTVENALSLAGFDIQKLSYVDTCVLHDSGWGELHCGTNARRFRNLVNVRESEHEE